VADGEHPSRAVFPPRYLTFLIRSGVIDAAFRFLPLPIPDNVQLGDHPTFKLPLARGLGFFSITGLLARSEEQDKQEAVNEGTKMSKTESESAASLCSVYRLCEGLSSVEKDGD
jgi:hypothetical protein